MLALGGAAFYLAGLTPLRQYIQRLAGLAPPQAAVRPPGNPPVGAQPPAAGNGGAAAPAGRNPAELGGAVLNGRPDEHLGNGRGNAAAPAGGLLHELQAFVIGFFTSLLPGEPIAYAAPVVVDWFCLPPISLVSLGSATYN